MGFVIPAAVGRLTAAKLQTISDEIGGWSARKTADQSVANSTLVNDTELFVPVIATAVYYVAALIIYRAAATPLFKFGWTGPAGATMSWCPNCLSTAVTAAVVGSINKSIAVIGTAPSGGAAGIGTSVCAEPVGTLITTGTAGNLQLQIAQDTTNATATIVKADSMLYLVRVA